MERRLDENPDAKLRDGRTFTLRPGASFHVSGFGDATRRTSTGVGAKVFIVD